METARERAVKSVRHDDVPLSNITRIKAAFRKPVEEPFETTTRPLE